MPQTDQPLPPATFWVLFALATGDKHGYAIMRESRKLSDGQFEMGPATLYTTIQRLVDSGWIEEVSGPEDGDPRRRYYSLAKPGKSALMGEMKRMEAVMRKSKALHLWPAEGKS
ncbi:MAG TPA: PadR family transcriptional regulator [Bryobacteraceae bacterium]|nr:PadR family transcriptional regulator [Bryobacteraceae bacterium]